MEHVSSDLLLSNLFVDRSQQFDGLRLSKKRIKNKKHEANQEKNSESNSNSDSDTPKVSLEDMYQDPSGKQLNQYEQFRALMFETAHEEKHFSSRVRDLYHQSHELVLIPFTLVNIQHIENDVEKVNHQFFFNLIEVMKEGDQDVPIEDQAQNEMFEFGITPAKPAEKLFDFLKQNLLTFYYANPESLYFMLVNSDNFNCFL